MNLITIHQQEITRTEEVNSVNARDLYEHLEVKKHFTDWMAMQIDRGFFEKDKDYVLLHQKVKREIGSSTRKDYLLTIETAKHIAMMSQTQKGKEARDYFIEIEKQYHSLKEVLEAATEKFRLGMPQEPNKRRVGTPLTDKEKEICELYFRVDQTNAHISRVLGCDTRTVGRYRAEYDDGEREPELEYREEQVETLPLYEEEV